MSKEKQLSVRVERADNLPGFGAWCAGSLEDGEGVVLLNVRAHFLAARDMGGDPAKMLLSSIVHEIGHAVQEWMGEEFDEAVVDEIADTYLGDFEYEPTEDEREAAVALVGALVMDFEGGSMDEAYRDRFIELMNNFGFELNWDED